MNDNKTKYLCLDALLSLLDMLRGVFNVESVISPIDLHISSAIMQFQEKAFDISNKVRE
jgi:hypothetical protein